MEHARPHRPRNGGELQRDPSCATRCVRWRPKSRRPARAGQSPIRCSARLPQGCGSGILIRPGGESRLSNFLLYQAAYTELVMSEVYWPDFGRDHFASALAEYQQRQRRYGGS